MGQTLPTDDPDPLTIERFRAGDIDALVGVVDCFGGRVYRLARRMAGSDVDAEDLTQEIFVRAFERAASFRGDARFGTWLHSLAVHHCINHIRRRKLIQQRERSSAHMPERVTPARDNGPDRRLLAGERAAAIQAALDGLPAGHRACLVLREMEGLSYERIAQLLEIPAGTVMSRLARARRQLRESLHEHEENPAAGNNAAARIVQSSEESNVVDL